MPVKKSLSEQNLNDVHKLWLNWMWLWKKRNNSHDYRTMIVSRTFKIVNTHIQNNHNQNNGKHKSLACSEYDFSI